jgi:uncharacterized protein
MQRRIRRMLALLLISCVVLYVVVLVGVYTAQDRLVYVGAGLATSRTPAEIGLAYEPLTLTTDTIAITGWFIPAPAARGTVLLFHGNGSTMSCCIQHALLFYQANFNTLLIDYRGYGASAGTPTEHGLYADAEAAWRYLTETRGVAPQTIVIAGQSLGGGVATWLAARYQAGGLILDSTFTSLVDIGARQYPFLPVRLLSRNRFPSLDRIGDLRVPVLILHSRDDALIAYAHAEQLYAAAPNPKTLVALRGPHAAGPDFDPATYAAAVATFLAGLELRR